VCYGPTNGRCQPRQRRTRGHISPHHAKGRVALVRCDTGNRITAMVSLLMLADQASRHTNHNVTRPVPASNCPAQLAGANEPAMRRSVQYHDKQATTGRYRAGSRPWTRAAQLARGGSAERGRPSPRRAACAAVGTDAWPASASWSRCRRCGRAGRGGDRNRASHHCQLAAEPGRDRAPKGVGQPYLHRPLWDVHDASRPGGHIIPPASVGIYAGQRLVADLETNTITPCGQFWPNARQTFPSSNAVRRAGGCEVPGRARKNIPTSARRHSPT
jgi:hypothetical protein